MSEEDRTTATGNILEKIGKVRLHGFRDTQADKQTDIERVRRE